MRWTIGRRLTAIGGLAITAAATVGTIGLLQTIGSGQRADSAFTVAQTLTTTVDAQHSSAVILADAEALATQLTDERRRVVVDQLTEHAEELRAQLDSLRGVRMGPEIDPAIAALIPSIEALLSDSTQLVQTTGALPRSVQDSVQAHWNAFDEQSDVAKGLLTDLSAAQTAGAQASSSGTVLVLLLVTIGAAIVVGLVTALMARSIAAPIRATRGLLERVAAGDFTGRTTVRATGDLGEMATALDTTVERVGRAVGSIASEATALTSAAGRLTEVSQLVSTGAHQVAAGAEQMQTSIAEVIGHAAVATDIVTSAVSTAEDANRTVSRLAGSSDQIGQVIKVIAAIAEQTNLLALNAAIEAARAGDMGKGFAVVAGEVKDLAAETARATEDISRQIAALQRDSTDAAAVIDGFSATVNRVADIQRLITGAVERQSAATAEIGERVDRAAAELTMQAAEELATTASSLLSVVAQFRVPGA